MEGISNKKFFQKVFESATFPSARIVSERNAGFNAEIQEGVYYVAEESPDISTRLLLPNFKLHIHLPGDFCKKMICSHFIKPIQNLQNGDHALRLQFCNWLCEHWRLHKYTFYLEMRLTITSIAIELITKLQNRFIVNVWCGMLGD